MSLAYAIDGRARTATLRKAATVLMVDDDHTYVAMVTLKLETEGHTVFFASDGAEGLEMVHRQPPDLIFLDVVLPGISGLELLATLKADPATRDIPVVVVSGRCERQLIEDCRRLGAVDFLFKTMSVPATLAQAVQSFARTPHP